MAKRKRLKSILKLGSALNPRPVTDPRTGRQYPTHAQMVSAQRQFRASIETDFARLVEEKTLGIDPWELLPGESPLQYSRFRQYLTGAGLDPRTKKRSVARTASVSGVSEGVLHIISAKWHWVLRAACWDREMDRQADDEFREAKRVSIRSQAKLGRRLQALAMKGADNMLAVGGADLDANSVAKLADVGVKIERLANGDSTKNEAVQVETRLVWDGPQPKWANAGEDVVAAHQVERPVPGPLQRKIRELTMRTPSDPDVQDAEVIE